MRVEPLKWWLLGPPVDVDSSLASVLDLSHAYCCLSLRGPSVTDLLSRHLALDLRDAERFVASTVMHHTGVTLQVETDDCYLYLPRGFSRSLYEILFESALQFGIEVR